MNFSCVGTYEFTGDSLKTKYIHFGENRYDTFKNFNNIEVEELSYCELKNCKNIKADRTGVEILGIYNCQNIEIKDCSDRIYFENCSNIKINGISQPQYASIEFKNCSNIEFGFEAPEGNNYDITFENCSGYLKNPGDFWAVYKNCKFEEDEAVQESEVKSTDDKNIIRGMKVIQDESMPITKPLTRTSDKTDEKVETKAEAHVKTKQKPVDPKKAEAAAKLREERINKAKGSSKK